MAEKSDLLTAFDATVESFERDWSRSLPDQELAPVDGTLRSIGDVCGFVVDFDDPLPDHTYYALFRQIHLGSEDLKQDIGKRPTYATAKACLLKLVERRTRRPQSPY